MKTVPPLHLPCLLAFALALMVQPGESSSEHDLLLTHLRPLITPTPTPNPVDDILVPAESSQDRILQFTKRVYRDLGNTVAGDNARTRDKFRDEYQTLDTLTNGRLGPALSSLFEIRLLDLQASVRHTRRMHKVLEEFMRKPDGLRSI